MRILVDMNLSPAWVAFLLEAGFEAVHWSAIGEPTAPDNVLMSWAKENDHAVLTADLDFSALLAVNREMKPSVIQVRSELPMPHLIGDAVLLAIETAKEDLHMGALVTVDSARTRVRILPLGP